VSADLDALDRGVIEAGLVAAEALARVAALERQVAALERNLLNATAARAAAAPEPKPSRHLRAVPPTGGTS
jgi:hypothetical protein